MLCFLQVLCFLDFDYQPLVLKNSTKVWKLPFLLFLTRGKMVRVILWWGVGGGCSRVCMCKAFEPLRWVLDGLPLELLTGGQCQQLPGDLMPPLQVARHHAHGLENLGLANPAGDTHYLVILMPGWACCSLHDNFIRETSPEPLLRARAWLPLTIQVPFCGTFQCCTLP